MKRRVMILAAVTVLGAVAGVAGTDGGGGYFYGGTATHCTFLENRARTGGGGVVLYGVYSTRLFNSTVQGNVASGGSGGGVNINRGSVFNICINHPLPVINNA